MAATKEDIRSWLKRGKESGATHMIVVCDTYDHEDYPVYVMPDENVRTKSEQFNGKNIEKELRVLEVAIGLDRCVYNFLKASQE